MLAGFLVEGRVDRVVVRLRRLEEPLNSQFCDIWESNCIRV